VGVKVQLKGRHELAKPGMPAEGFTPSHRGKTVSKLFALELLGLGLSEFPELRNH
jgi:hypothetical protein